MNVQPRELRSQTPCMTGSAGRAWQLDIEAMHDARPEPKPPRELSLASWTVYAPGAHPLWHSYTVACVSLRDVPGTPPATITVAGATHEIVVYALEPRQVLHIDRAPVGLQPLNYVGQFYADSDAEAEDRCRQAVRAIVDGRLSPDSDFVAAWRARFEQSIAMH